MIPILTERWKAFVERIERLPPDEQDSLLQQIEDALDNAKWRALLADPRSGPILDAMIERAKQSPKRPWPPLEEQDSGSSEAPGS